MASTYVRCPGCGGRFKGQRGLRAHQTQPHATMACRPRADDALWRLRNLTGEPRLTEGDEG